MSQSYRGVTVALLLLTTMIAFESMAITTAMPVAAAELGAVASYGLAFSSMMTAMLLGIVSAGPWADRRGPLPGMYAGQTLFALGAVTCAVAPTFGILLLGRVVTGLGAGLVMVVEFVAVGRVYPAQQRPRVFTWLSAAWVLPSVLGAPIAGWLAATTSWRTVFWVVVAPAAVAFLLVSSRRLVFQGGPDRPGVDLQGERQPTAGRRELRYGVVVALSCGLVQFAIHEQPSLVSWLSVGAALGLLGLLAATPRLLPDGTLRSRPGLPSVVLSRALLNGAFMGSVTYLPLFFVQERGMSLTLAGAVLAVAAVGWSTGSWIQGRLKLEGPSQRRWLVAGGAACLTVAGFGLATLVALQAPDWAFAVLLVPLGVAMGIGSTTLSVLVLDLSPAHEHGRASAALQLADVLGSVVSIAAATAAFAVLHAGGESRAYVVIFASLAAVAALAIPSGTRCAPARQPVLA